MKRGELPSEPELNLDSYPRTVKSRTYHAPPVLSTEIHDVEQDAFFGDDSSDN